MTKAFAFMLGNRFVTEEALFEGIRQYLEREYGVRFVAQALKEPGADPTIVIGSLESPRGDYVLVTLAHDVFRPELVSKVVPEQTAMPFPDDKPKMEQLPLSGDE